MRKMSFVKTLLLALSVSLSFSVSAASLSLTGTTKYNANGFKGTISEVQNINVFLSGAFEGFYVSKPNPTAMSAAHVQIALTAAGSSFLVTDFFKINDPATNTLNTSSLGFFSLVS